MFTATLDSFSRKHYALLGKLLIQKEPETAQKLIQTFIPEDKPQEEDFTKIPALFERFCLIKGYDHNTAPRASKVETRRLFIAAVLHLYNPHVYNQPANQIILKYGFVRNISQVLHQKESNVSTMIREVILWEKQYEDFSNNVNSIIEKLTNGTKC